MPETRSPGAVRTVAAFFALLLFFFTCAPVLSGLPARAEAAPKISIDPTVTIDGSTATATVLSDMDITTPVTVYYHTENRSAVAGQDFRAQSGSVTLQGRSACIYVSLIKSIGPYATSLSNGNSYGRQFCVVLDRVEGGGATLDADRKVGTCTLKGEMNIPITLSPGLAYADVYVELLKDSFSDWHIEDEDSESDSNMFSSGNWGAYVSRGLAQAYTTFTISEMDHHGAVSSGTHVDYTLTDSGWNNLLYFWEDTCASGGYQLTTDQLSTLLSGSNPHGGYGASAIDARDIKVSATTKYLYTNSTIGGPDSYFLLVPLRGSSVNVNLTIKNTAKVRDIYYSGVHYMRLVDTKAPTVSGVYLDDSSLASSGKLRLSVRFSEPVRSKMTDYSSVDVKLKRADGTLTSEVYSFYYAGGNYTDTIYYECPISVGTAVYGFKIEEGDSRIVDLAYCVNSSHSYYSNAGTGWPTDPIQNLATPFVYVKPTVSVTGGYGTRQYATQQDLMVHTGAPGCTVYTLWNHDDKDVTDVDAYLAAGSVDEFAGESGSISFGDNVNGDGLWYLHVLAVNRYGLRDVYTSESPYRIDRTAPSLSCEITQNDICHKKFTLRSADTGSGLSRLEILIDGTPYTIWDKAGGLDTAYARSVTDEEGEAYVYSSCIKNAEGETNPIDRRILDVMEREGVERRKFSLSFRATDSALGPTGSNVTTSRPVTVTYDTRENFAVQMYFDGAEVVETDMLICRVGANVPVYNVQKSSVSVSIAPKEPDKMTGTTLFLVDENGREHPGTEPLALGPGFHELTLLARGEDFVLVSNAFSFYLTDSMTEDTRNAVAAEGNILFTNEVFRLSGISYTFLSGSETPTPIRTAYGALPEYKGSARFVGGSSEPTFSDDEAAARYIRTMEYLDMKLVRLDPDMAGSLKSSNITAYARADGESVDPQPGQLWIRYKRNTWTQLTDANGGWAYYFYAFSGAVEDGINVNLLSANLKGAVTDVTNYVLANGHTVYLVGDERSAATGAPRLADAQIHVTRETWTETWAGTPLSPTVLFEPDDALYHNTVAVGLGDYPLATNLFLHAYPGTYLFAHLDGQGETFRPLILAEGKEDTVRHLLSVGGEDAVSGVYVIREVDGTGVRDFKVFVDTATPGVMVMASKMGSPIPEENHLHAGQGTISGTKLTFVSFEDEIDPEAFVAVFTYRSQDLLHTYYADDLVGGVTLEGSNYYVEVGDRSGNVYSFYVVLTDSKMETQITESDYGNGFTLRVTNRTSDEIFRYEVHYNGANQVVDKDVLVDRGQSFSLAGVYSILIQDIYGSSYVDTYVFNYKVPEVTWYYLDSGGSPVLWDPDAAVGGMTGMTMALVGDLSYRITAATTLRVFISNKSGTPGCAFDGLVYGQDYTVHENTYITKKDPVTQSWERLDGTIVEITALTDWTLRVYYVEHPENVITYSCAVDMTPPEMQATYVGAEYVRDETAAMAEAAKSGVEGALAHPAGLTFTKGKTVIRTLQNGDVFSGDCITLSFLDPSGIHRVEILVDGKPVEADASAMPFILNEWGKYEITAYDCLGNRSYFTFTNEPPASAIFSADGAPVADLPVWGHDTLTMTALSDGENEILIHVGDRDYYFRYLVSRGVLYQSFYQYTTGVKEGEIVDGEAEMLVQTVIAADPLLSLDASGYTPGDVVSLLGERYAALLRDLFGLPAEDGLPFDVSASFDAKGIATFTVTLREGAARIEMRFVSEDDKPPAYVQADYSLAQSDVSVITGGREVILPHDGNVVYVTGDITVFPCGEDGSAPAAAPEILTVDLGFSLDNVTWTTRRLYTAGETAPVSYTGTSEGFYRLVIVNRWGNETRVTFSLSPDFRSTASVTYRDGYHRNWTVVGEDLVVYSNSSVTVSAFREGVAFTVDGLPKEADELQGVLSITFSAIGDEAATYVVTMTDMAGNVKTVTVMIGTDPDFAFDEGWLTGYTEGALRRDEGYTSDPLSVILPEGTDVAIVTVTSENGQARDVYDAIGPLPITSELVRCGCVGAQGDGVYVVSFRNKWGDTVSRTVHFRRTPTLSLSRITSYSGAEEAYDLPLALERGFYSNRTLIFSTSAEKYDFRVGGAATSLESPKRLEFTSSSGEGTIPYEITYVDEYGMKYVFEAVLKRQNELVDTSAQSQKIIEGTVYTSDDLFFALPEGLTAFVSVDRAENVPYESGRIFRADGRYAFTFVDFSGNVQHFTVIHDSLAHFSVRDRASDLAIINGSAVNADSVIFVSDPADTSTLMRVFLNGREQKNYTSNVFSQTGHWELLVSDAVGNVEFFTFDLLNHALAEYHFTAPYGYVISEVWRTDEDGNKQLTSGLTSEGNRRLDLTFEGDEIARLSYGVILISEYDNDAINFTVQLDNTPPEVTLVGVEDGGDTPYEVSFSGAVGNTVTIWRDGELYSTVYVQTPSDVPVLTEGGKYRVEIVNDAGVMQSFAFTKRYIANAAASVLMIVACLGVSTAIFIGLLLRNRSKIDD